MATVTDWTAAARVADGLGIHTRELVAGRDVDRIVKWAREMERGSVGPRAASYGELVALVAPPELVKSEPDPEVPEETEEGGDHDAA